MHSFLIAICGTLHDVLIVANERKKTRVDARDDVEVMMSVSRCQRRDRRIETGRIAESHVFVAGRKQRRYCSHMAGVKPLLVELTTLFNGPAVEVRHHHPRGVDLGSRDMAVHVDCSRHHNLSTDINSANANAGLLVRCRWRNDQAVQNPDVCDFIDVIRRVDDASARETEIAHRKSAIVACVDAIFVSSFSADRKRVLRLQETGSGMLRHFRSDLPSPKVLRPACRNSLRFGSIDFGSLASPI